MKNEQELLAEIEKLFAQKSFAEALKLLEEHWDLCQKKYYELLDYRLQILMKFNRFAEVYQMLLVEFSQPYIPLAYEKKFRQYFRDIKFQFNEKHDSAVNIPDLINEKESVLLENLYLLADFNLHRFLPEMQYLLNRNDLSNITKSLILALLSDQKINHNFQFMKDDKFFVFNPLTSMDVRLTPAYQYFDKYCQSIEKKLDINQHQLFKNLIETFLLDIYPGTLKESEYTDLENAVKYILNEVYHSDIFPLSENFKTEKGQLFIKKLNNLINSI